MGDIAYVLEIAGAPDMPVAERAALLARLEAAILEIYGGIVDDVCMALHAHLDAHDFAPQGIYWSVAFERAQAIALQGGTLPAGARFVADYVFTDEPEGADEPGS
ncbi:MAG: hypothetical protein AB7I35_01265 [Ramlibacter sp.]